MNLKALTLVLISVLMIHFNAESKEKKFYKETLNQSAAQLSHLLNDAYMADRIPRTVNNEGEIHWTRENWEWTEGFFPGTCWYLYEYTGKDKWKKGAEFFQAKFIEHRKSKSHHDLGFVFNCSYGNDYRINGTEESKEILIDAANSLKSRFNENVGSIKSWDVDRGWQATRGWKFPVIIDNMMNLELLFEASILTGDSKYKDIAIAHAKTTMKNHFREDNSSFHVVDYDPETGAVRHKHTAQGYAHESSWARGQAWGLYGFTLCYRYTKDEQFLKQAVKIANLIVNSPFLPKDKIPFWDYNAPDVPNEPRDASATAITASALVELSQYSKQVKLDDAQEILRSLASDAYFAKEKSNNNFVLMHSVGSIPHNNEIDKPLNYADYYFVEALMRLMKIEN